MVIHIHKHRPDGRKYEGEWKRGKQHGKGKITNIRGEVHEYDWVNGQRVKQEKVNDNK